VSLGLAHTIYCDAKDCTTTGIYDGAWPDGWWIDKLSIPEGRGPDYCPVHYRKRSDLWATCRYQVGQGLQVVWGLLLIFALASALAFAVVYPLFLWSGNEATQRRRSTRTTADRIREHDQDGRRRASPRIPRAGIR